MKKARPFIICFSILFALFIFPVTMMSQDVNIDDGCMVKITAGTYSNIFASSTATNASTATIQIGGVAAVTVSFTGNFSNYFGSISFYDGSTLNFNPSNSISPAKIVVEGVTATTTFVKKGAGFSISGYNGSNTIEVKPYGVLDLTNAANTGDLTLAKGLYISSYNNTNTGQIRFKIGSLTPNKMICSTGRIYTNDPTNGQIDVSKHFYFDMAGATGTPGTDYNIVVAHTQDEPYFTGSPNVVNAGDWSNFNVTKAAISGGWDIRLTATYQCTNPGAGGIIATDQSACVSFDPNEITSSSLPSGQHGTLEYKWQKSITGNSSGFSDIAGTNATTYNPATITQTTWYKRVARVTCMSSWTGAAESNVVKMTVNPLPVVSLTVGGTGSICSGTGTNITVALSVTGTNYQLRNDAGDINVGSPVAGTGGTINLPTGNLTLTTTFNVLATIASTLCTAELTGMATVSIIYIPVAAGTITGTETVCQSQSGISYSVPAITHATSYAWAYSGTGVTIHGITNSITIDFSSSATSGNLTVYGVNICGNGTISANYAITVNPLPVAAGAITGTSALCQLTNGVAYSVPEITYALSYSWAYSGTGATLHITANSITIDFSISATSGNLTVYGVNGCGNGSVSANYPITVNPIPTPSITGINEVCTNTEDYIYSTPYNAGRTYDWIVTGGTITDGLGTNEITVTWGSGTSGSVEVTEIVQSTLCSASNTMNTNINLVPAPLVSGATHVSFNAIETYTTANVSGHSYVWSVTGGSLVSPQGSHSMDIWWSSMPGPGSVTVTETSSSGECEAVSSLNITLGYPDVTPNITAEPNIMHGVQNFNSVIQVTELLNVSTDGTITVFIPIDSRWSFTWDPDATIIGTSIVTNSAWNYVLDSPYHKFISTSVIPAGSYSKFGFIAVWNAGATVGTYTITSQIVSGSGGEIRIDNNVDAEKLDYFIN